MLAVTTGVVAGLALLGSDARAADTVSACFARGDTGVAGVVTSIEARTTSGWRYLGTGGATGASGCVRIAMPGAWRTQDVRVRGAQVVRGGAAVTTATTYAYARKGSGRYALGTGILGRTVVPVAAGTRSVAAVGAGGNASCRAGAAFTLDCWLAQTGAALGGASIPALRR
jgi:hypothetical protein